MRLLPNPVKETRNRAKHRWDFGRIGTIFANPLVEEPDDRPLGYEHEGRVHVIGRIGTRIVLLVFEPVEMEDRELAVRPILLRDATPGEERAYWERIGWSE